MQLLCSVFASLNHAIWWLLALWGVSWGIAITVLNVVMCWMFFHPTEKEERANQCLERKSCYSQRALCDLLKKKDNFFCAGPHLSRYELGRNRMPNFDTVWYFNIIYHGYFNISLFCTSWRLKRFPWDIPVRWELCWMRQASAVLEKGYSESIRICSHHLLYGQSYLAWHSVSVCPIVCFNKHIFRLPEK